MGGNYFLIDLYVIIYPFDQLSNLKESTYAYFKLSLSMSYINITHRTVSIKSSTQSFFKPFRLSIVTCDETHHTCPQLYSRHLLIIIYTSRKFLVYYFAWTPEADWKWCAKPERNFLSPFMYYVYLCKKSSRERGRSPPPTHPSWFRHLCSAKNQLPSGSTYM